VSNWLTWLVLVGLALLPGRGMAEPDPLKMGFYLPAIREASLADLKVSLTVWADEVSRPYGVKIRTSTYEDMLSMRGALERADLNFINAPGMELAELFRPDDIRQGYARRHHGVDEGLALVVIKNSGIRSFSGLRGKRLARLSNDRLSQYFLETQCLKVAAMDCQDFLRLLERKRDIQSVYDVFFGRVDAALVQLATLRTAGELNPQVTARLQVILDWKADALFFGIMTRHTDEHYRSLIINSINEAVKTPRGQQLLELFKTDYLEPVDGDALKPYWTLLREYNELRKARRAKRK
jgi:hypothetical protein